MNALADADLRARLPAAPTDWAPTALRLAAVLVPWFRRDDADFVLFTVRRRDLRQHAGQISFPGGMRSADEGPVACALRESAEEVGLPAAGVTVLGGLAPRISSSGILVHAVVARIPDPVALCIDPNEVERLLAIPWALLREPSRWQALPPPHGGPGPISPHFAFGGDLVWGLTGRFVQDLVQALTGSA